MATHIDHRKNFDELKRALTAFQISLHAPEDTEKGADYPGNQVHTIFFSQYRRATWYFQYPERLDITAGEGVHYTYRAKPQPHGLLYSDLCQRLPTVICQDGYEARWTPNVGSNIMISGQFVFNDDPLQTIDYITADMYGQSMVEEGARDGRDIDLGNLLSLQEWQPALHAYDTSFVIPWFYSRDVSTYFPLYFCGFLDRVEHRLTLRRDIAQLLMVRSVAEHKLVPFSPTSIRSVDGKAPTESHKMPMPVMWAQYLYLSDIECSHNRCTTTDMKVGRINSYRNVMYIDDVIARDDENPASLGSTITLKVENSEFPVHAFGWVAQNETALEAGYYSNYSTNTEDHRQGWSPIEHTSIHHGKGFLFRDLPALRTERVHPSIHYPCRPRAPGFNFWSLGVKAKDHNPKPGIVLKNGTMSVRLRDTNPLIGIKTGEVPCTALFRVRFRLTFTKQVVFTDFPDQESMRPGRHAVLETRGAYIS